MSLQLSTRDLSYFSASEMYTAQSFVAAASSLLTIKVIRSSIDESREISTWRCGTIILGDRAHKTLGNCGLAGLE
jgi:hypothetical protein